MTDLKPMPDVITLERYIEDCMTLWDGDMGIGFASYLAGYLSQAARIAPPSPRNEVNTEGVNDDKRKEALEWLKDAMNLRFRNQFDIDWSEIKQTIRAALLAPDVSELVAECKAVLELAKDMDEYEEPLAKWCSDTAKFYFVDNPIGVALSNITAFERDVTGSAVTRDVTGELLIEHRENRLTGEWEK